jgi:hypothetical protein
VEEAGTKIRGAVETVYGGELSIGDDLAAGKSGTDRIPLASLWW